MPALSRLNVLRSLLWELPPVFLTNRPQGASCPLEQGLLVASSHQSQTCPSNEMNTIVWVKNKQTKDNTMEY